MRHQQMAKNLNNLDYDKKQTFQDIYHNRMRNAIFLY